MKRVQALYLLFVWASFLFIISGCDKDPVKSPDLGYDYYPTETGHYVIYEIDSIFHDSALEVHDTVHYEVKEVVAGQFQDNEGRPAQRIERLQRKNDTANWKISDVWYGNKNSERAEKVIEDQRFVKLVFPVKEGESWDGNAYNTMDEWDFEYEFAHTPSTINGMSFDSTVTVRQRENINLVETEISQEVYAKHIGLVSKSFTDLDTYVSGEIKKGVEIKLVIQDYGNAQ